MAKDVNSLSERIKRVDKDAKMAAICELMNTYLISLGDLIEYHNTKGIEVKSTAARLKEINQVRKAARKRKEDTARALEAARKAKKEKKEVLLASVPEIPEITVSAGE